MVLTSKSNAFDSLRCSLSLSLFDIVQSLEIFI